MARTKLQLAIEIRHNFILEWYKGSQRVKLHFLRNYPNNKQGGRPRVHNSNMSNSRQISHPDMEERYGSSSTLRHSDERRYNRTLPSQGRTPDSRRKTCTDTSIQTTQHLSTNAEQIHAVKPALENHVVLEGKHSFESDSWIIGHHIRPIL